MLVRLFILRMQQEDLNCILSLQVEVQQGNIITQEMVDQLLPGMTRSQVRFIMGTPLIADAFNQNRWDYFYSLVDRNEDEVRERLIIFFEDDKLARISGDFTPSSASTRSAANADSEETKIEEVVEESDATDSSETEPEIAKETEETEE